MACFEFIVCFTVITVGFNTSQGSCSPVLDTSNRSECNNRCGARHFCDKIEQRCSPCSPKACELGLGQPECHHYCTDYHRGDGLSLTTTAREYEKVLQDSYNSKDRWIAIVQLVFTLVIFTLIFLILIIQIRNKMTREQCLKDKKSEVIEVGKTQPVKMNNFDGAMYTGKPHLYHYVKGNLCNATSPSPCVSDVVVSQCICDSSLEGETESADLGETLRVSRVDTARQLPESRALISGHLLPPSPLDQNL